jgi:hypothetical protein
MNMSSGGNCHPEVEGNNRLGGVLAAATENASKNLVVNCSSLVSILRLVVVASSVQVVVVVVGGGTRVVLGRMMLGGPSALKNEDPQEKVVLWGRNSIRLCGSVAGISSSSPSSSFFAACLSPLVP